MIKRVDKVILAVTEATKEIYALDEGTEGNLPDDEPIRVATLVNLMLGVIEKASIDPDFGVIVAAVALDRLMVAEAR
jgi:hypothetical protein